MWGDRWPILLTNLAKCVGIRSRLRRRPPPPPRQGRVLAVSWIMTRVRIWEKHRVVCGFSWVLRVIGHEAVLMDPKLFSSWVHRSVVLLKREFGRQTSSRWRFSRKNDWIMRVTPQQAIKAIPVLSLYSRNSGPAAEVGMALFTTALGRYERKGAIAPQRVP
jgi:hypothetical protein